jgi:hypothetical protein
MRPRPRLALAAAALALSGLLGACAEDLDGGAACATLCPGTNIQSVEVSLAALTAEHVVPGILETGTELLLPLIDRKDTVQTRVVVRFDTLVTRYQPGTDTTTRPIDTLGDASLLLTLDRARSTVQDSIVVEVYDIDNGTEDTTTAGIESRIVPSRLVGSRRLAAAGVLDTIGVPLANAFVQGKLLQATDAARRVRLAVRVTSPRSVVLRVIPTVPSRSDGPRIRYKQASAPATALFNLRATSDVPADPVVAQALADFATLPVRSPSRSDAVFAVGGLPARRTVLRFAIPDSIDDAAAIVQAELRLVQLPDPLRNLVDTIRVDTSATGLRARSDTVLVAPLIGVGGASLVTDPVRAGQIARRSVGADGFFVAGLRLVPSDSGTRAIDVAGLLRRWRSQADADPRYLVLASESEGAQAATAYFWSSAASNPALRPTLYIRYIPRVGFGIP